MRAQKKTVGSATNADNGKRELVSIKPATIITQKHGGCKMKAEYIEKIVSLLNECNDVPLLDMIYRILWKTVKGAVDACGKLN